MCVCVYLYNVCMYVSMYVCVYVCVCVCVSLYPEAEADSKELVGAHLGPGPVPKALSVAHGEDAPVLSAAEGLAGSLQEDLLLTAGAGQRRQHGHRGEEETLHVDQRSVGFGPEALIAARRRPGGCSSG